MTVEIKGGMQFGKSQRKSVHELACTIADELFINGAGKKADRLQLKMPPDEHDGGGWCYNAVVQHIEKILSENLFWNL